ncbi:MAG TPA: hypothetical protein VGQ83_33525, partial [Polyangia bacterium]
LLDALERAGALSLRDDEFDKDGELIRFRRADLRPGAREVLAGEGVLCDEPAAPAARGPGRKKATKKATKRKAKDPAGAGDAHQQ